MYQLYNCSLMCCRFTPPTARNHARSPISIAVLFGLAALLIQTPTGAGTGSLASSVLCQGSGSFKKAGVGVEGARTVTPQRAYTGRLLGQPKPALIRAR